MKANVIGVILVLGLTAGGLVSAADQAAFSGEWTQVDAGVFKSVDQNGVITVSAFGQSGADFDRASHNAEIARLKAKASQNRASSDDLSQLAILQHELELIPSSVSSVIQPESSTNGVMCDLVWYSLDSQFAVGKGGMMPIARANWGFTMWGPAPPLPDVSLYSRAQWFSPYFPTQTNTKSDWMYATALVDVQQGITDGWFVGPSDCSAATYSSVTVNQGIKGCNAAHPGFASLTKTYPTCVGSL